MRAVFLAPLTWLGLLETQTVEASDTNVQGLLCKETALFDQPTFPKWNAFSCKTVALLRTYQPFVLCCDFSIRSALLDGFWPRRPVWHDFWSDPHPFDRPSEPLFLRF
jgi:hypothetical protein